MGGMVSGQLMTLCVLSVLGNTYEMSAFYLHVDLG